MGQLGAQAVKDHLNELKREGDPKPLAHYESLKGHKAKLDFALSLKLDRKASFRSAMETHKASTREEQGQEEGWLTMEQIALKEGLTHYLTNENQKDLLEQILEGLSQRKHKDPWRAAKGHKQYEYTCESMKKTMNIQESSMELQASNGDIATHDWEEVVTRITGGQGTRSIGNGSRTTSGTNKPKAVEVTEEQKNKQHLIKNL
jgi:hypothetical protein